jgi:hypothetical protein
MTTTWVCSPTLSLWSSSAAVAVPGFLNVSLGSDLGEWRRMTRWNWKA